MKRILAAFALAALLALPAAADTLAQQIQTEASRLLLQVKSAEAAANAKPSARPAPLSPALVADLQRFGLAAVRLSGEIDKAGGPKDLRCIFRGMAAETDNQLKAASGATNGAAQAKALSRLNHMLSDAVLIAPAVGGPAQVRAAANARSAAAQQCEISRDF
ncbi:MAG: hypothetical protein B7Z38_05780 [Rhodobacterales bacterium 12-64-8]|nr:MAG: hypothetical protein B7Z38_05780 [Rhodobacterales bacterium 12-64-8]OYX50191.1 MAG: hypothetical protein B7Y90_04200 [Alphaproteobacteria bacterium 32-64-14]